ncbi:MAG: hypothetical protein LBB42_05840 [Coriobacteriales bacterium]|jgi:acetyl-CoA carboxylase biotin carboxyl carrier protein|nr:hypothetical protein [Coriobacteriales bacterium]
MTTTLPYHSSSVEEHIEQLAVVLDKHALTRVEYELGELRVVLEKSEVPCAASSTAPCAAPYAALGLTGAGEKSSANLAGPANPPNSAGFAGSVSSVSLVGSSSTASSVGTDSSPSSAKQLVKAPLVGIAYRSKEPGAAPFVSVGDTVEEGAVLCLIEAMKMFNEVKAPCGGTVTCIHFEDASLVEHGEPLVSLS